MRTLPFRILAIVDEETLGEQLPAKAAAAARGGLRWFCLRSRRATTAERVRLGRAVLRACPGIFLSVHGDPEAAASLGTTGVHLPSQLGNLPDVVRGCEESGSFWGVSCHARDELEAAQAAGADYALLSPFRAPVSKPAGGPVLGADGLARATRGLTLPVLALGGVTPEALAEAARAGAAGAAVLGALFWAEDVEARAAQYRAAAARLWPDDAQHS